MAISTKGVVVEYCTTSGGSYVPIVCHEFSVPKQSIHAIPVPDLSSTAELPIAGLQKIDDVSFKVYHTPDNITALGTLYGVGYYWKITYPDINTPTVIAFQGYLSEMDSKGKPNEAIVWECKVTITSIPTITPGS